MPAIDSAPAVTDALARTVTASCRVRVIGAATIDRAGARLAPLAEMAAAGAVGFSDDGSAVTESRRRRSRSMPSRSSIVPLFEHAESPERAGRGVMRGGPTATRLGLPGWPAEAELEVVERDLALARERGARVHLTHLSTAAAVRAVREGASRGNAGDL